MKKNTIKKLIIECNSVLARLYYSRGHLYMALENYNKAYNDFDKAIRLKK